MKARTVERTAEQREYHDWLRTRERCQSCGSRIDLVIHHLLADAPGKAGRRDHWFAVVICRYCHNMSAKSVHMLGSEAAFLAETGVDLVAVAVHNLVEYRAR